MPPRGRLRNAASPESESGTPFGPAAGLTGIVRLGEIGADRPEARARVPRSSRDEVDAADEDSSAAEDGVLPYGLPDLDHDGSLADTRHDRLSAAGSLERRKGHRHPATTAQADDLIAVDPPELPAVPREQPAPAGRGRHDVPPALVRARSAVEVRTAEEMPCFVNRDVRQTLERARREPRPTVDLSPIDTDRNVVDDRRSERRHGGTM